MMLVVANVLMRSIFSRPILGTYELVGLLTAMGVGLALANCAFKKGHIAVGFIVDRFTPRIQAIIDVFIYSVTMGFWFLVACEVAEYANNMAENGMVSSTTQIPIYPFIYLLALGILGLSLVLLLMFLNSISKALPGFSLARLPWQSEWQDNTRKASR
jgi:TRAP-type C4-dicarboxylate transport system permease small subunit